MIKNKTLDRLIETIVADIRPEKIFLISHYEKEEQCSHSTLDIEAAAHRTAKYDLLVLTNAGHDVERQSLFIETRTSIIAQVTALAYPMDEFNRALEYGHPFLMRLMASDSLVYNAETIDFAVEDCVDKDCTAPLGRENVLLNIANADEFYAASNLHTIRKSYQMAAFNLHQCAEQLYTAALRSETGLRYVANDIVRLQHYSYWYSEEMRKMLHIHNTTKMHLASILQKSFYNARYNPAYKINGMELLILSTGVRELFDLTLKLWRNRQVGSTESNNDGEIK